MNPRIRIDTTRSPWGTPTYHLSVDGVHVGDYRKLADARSAGEARIVYLKDQEDQLWEEIRNEWEDT